MTVSELKKKLEALEQQNLGDIQVYTSSDWSCEREVNRIYSVNIENHFPVIVLELEPPENEDELLIEGEFNSMTEVE